MDFYQRLIPKQSCVLCGELARLCVCPECEFKFTNHLLRCRSCAHPIVGNLDFCGQCLAHAPKFNRAYTLYDYQGEIARLIKAFKYNNQLCIGAYFARQLHILYRSILKTGVNYDAIIPMPLSRQRLIERGYNQVLELLRVIAKHERVVIDAQHCQRIKATQPLSSLKLDQRKQEIMGAFVASAMPYKNILLVDDVMTTGTSFGELTKTILRNTGIKRCDVMVLARAEAL